MFRGLRSFGPTSRAGSLVLAMSLLCSACGGGGGGGASSPPPPAPDFSLSLTPPASVQAGSSGSATVAVTRSNGHSAGLALSLGTNASGITGNGSVAAGAASGTLTLVVPITAQVGATTLTATASDGSVSHSATFSLTVAPGPDFSITVANPAAIPAGGAGTATVTVTRSHGHSAAITLGLATNPQGVAGSGNLAVGVTTGNLALAVPAALPPGSYTLTATASDGILTRSATFSLTVAPAAGFTLALGRSTVSASLADLPEAIPVTLTRVGGFSGAITLSVAGLPANVQAGFSPPSTTGGSSSLQLVVGANAAPTGATPLALTVKASAPGQPDATAPLGLSIATRPATQVTVQTWKNAAKANVSYAAWRDGKTGAWVPLSGTGGAYQFTVTDPAGLFSLVLSYAGDSRVGPQVRVINASLGEVKAPAQAAGAATTDVPDIEEGFGEGGMDYTDDSSDPTTSVTETASPVVAGGLYSLGAYPATELHRPLVTNKGATTSSISFQFDLHRTAAFTNYNLLLVGRYGIQDDTLALQAKPNVTISGPTLIDALDFIAATPGTPLTIPVDTSALGMSDMSVTQSELCPPGTANSPGFWIPLGGGGGHISTFTWPAPVLPTDSIFRADAIGSSSDWSRNGFHTIWWNPAFNPNPTLKTPPIPPPPTITRPAGTPPRVIVREDMNYLSRLGSSFLDLRLWQAAPGGGYLVHTESFTPLFTDLPFMAGPLDIANTLTGAPSSTFGPGPIDGRLTGSRFWLPLGSSDTSPPATNAPGEYQDLNKIQINNTIANPRALRHAMRAFNVNFRM
ncbi:MAG: hypothetical protein HY823_01105 [Acidobacteria bacterium]|nr:hypothetical protein [Acidobacteriota bacterium]